VRDEAVHKAQNKDTAYSANDSNPAGTLIADHDKQRRSSERGDEKKGARAREKQRSLHRAYSSRSGQHFANMAWAQYSQTSRGR
jgi:hypothetical protein